MAAKMDPSVQEELLLNRLKAILLKEDRAKLKQLRDTLDDPVLLSEKVSPILDQQLDFLKQNFPKEYEEAVDQIVKRRLEESQEEILNVIYPVLGKMIKKYITHQFQLMKDNIDASIRNSFKRRSLWQRIIAWLFGIKESEIVLASMDQPILDEIYVIERDSGLLKGSASRTIAVDQEVIAGMLTAIKSFAEDAFQREREDVEMISYGSYKIFIQNFHTYYIAVAMSGSVSSAEYDMLSNSILEFAEKELSTRQDAIESNFEYISTQLQTQFIEPFTSTSSRQLPKP